jgi:hypothetical protein
LLICQLADEDYYPIELLNEQLPSGFPPHRLCLKIGMCVMVLRNFDRRANLANGTKGIVMRVTRNAVKIRVIPTGEEVYLPRMVFLDDKSPLKLRRRQFPLRAAFAMTINKAQGQTLSHYGVFLPRNCFGHGQLYTALSRANNPTNVRVLTLPQPDLPLQLSRPDPEYANLTANGASQPTVHVPRTSTRTQASERVRAQQQRRPGDPVAQPGVGPTPTLGEDNEDQTEATATMKSRALRSITELYLLEFM